MIKKTLNFGKFMFRFGQDFVLVVVDVGTNVVDLDIAVGDCLLSLKLLLQ